MPREKKNAFGFSASYLAPETASSDDVYRLQTLLAKYGYLSNYQPRVFDQATKDAVSQFQSFYRIYAEEDGVADAATIDQLVQVRCGVEDGSPAAVDPRAALAPFVTIGAKWPNKQLTYRFLNATPDIAESRQEEIIREAFSRWEAVSGLAFSEVGSGDATLSVAFHAGSHGDGSPFDDQGGPDGNTLAHGFFPPPQGGPWAGALHFDEFELWKDEPGGQGIRLYNVALHEIGHCLGLAHSQDQTAIMFAYYSETRNDLLADDIAGIQSLYGGPAVGPTAIPAGEKVSGHLTGTDAENAYQVTVQNKLLVRLAGPAGEDFDVFVRHGAPVDRATDSYDEVSWGVTANELVTISDPKPGVYHILVHSYRGSGSYTLETEIS